MSGHSKWSTIKRQKGAADAKRGAIFTRIGNQIAIAARSGADPTMNPALALAIDKAKAANMPNANVQRAIDRVSDKSAAALEEITYEGYGPGGVGIIVETATDNRNRTLPEVKNALTKNGGSIADSGSVAFQFTRKGVIRILGNNEDMLLNVLDAGADDVVEENGELIAYTDQKDLMHIRSQLIELGYDVDEAELQYVPNVSIEIGDHETAKRILKVTDALEDLPDVVNVHTNANITVDIEDI